MTVSIRLNGSGTYVDDNVLERIDRLTDLLSEIYECIFYMISETEIGTENINIAKAEDILEFTCDKKPYDIEKYMEKEQLYFDRVIFIPEEQ